MVKEKGGLLKEILLPGGVIILIASGLTILSVSFAHNRYLENTRKWEQLGLIGDFWGGLGGTILSFLGFSVLVLGYLSQRRELEVQKEDLRETQRIGNESRDQFKSQAESLQKQLYLSRRQYIDSFFFKLLDRLRSYESKVGVGLYKDSKDFFFNAFVESSKSSTFPVNRTHLLYTERNNLLGFFLLLKKVLDVLNSIELEEAKKDLEEVFLAEFNTEFLNQLRPIVKVFARDANYLPFAVKLSSLEANLMELYRRQPVDLPVTVKV